MRPIPTRQATGGPRGCRAGCELDRCLRRWFETPLGQRLSEFERQAVEQYLPRLFGQNIVQVGVRQAGAPLIADSPIRHRVVLDRDPLARAASVLGTASALPFASAGVDALLLDHVLEFDLMCAWTLRDVHASTQARKHRRAAAHVHHQQSHSHTFFTEVEACGVASPVPGTQHRRSQAHRSPSAS